MKKIVSTAALSAALLVLHFPPTPPVGVEKEVKINQSPYSIDAHGVLLS